MIDLDRVRDDTPALQTFAYFNSAGTSLMPSPVFDAMLDYLHREQLIGGYETADERQEDTDNFYLQASRLINASTDEIAFCESASRAWQLFFYSIKLQKGDRIITTQLDYGSHFVSFIQQRALSGVETVVIDTDENGEVDLPAMEAAMDGRTKLLSLSHIPTANGVINPAADVGSLAKKYNVPFLLDACQSVGQIEVDVKAIGCTALSTTGRKYLRGPRGTGFLYIDKDALADHEPGWLEQNSVELLSRDSYRMRDSAKRFENFEVGFGARVGLGKALEYANDIGPQHIEQRIVALGEYCRQRLADIRGVTIADGGRHRGGIVMFEVAGHDPDAVRALLHRHRIQVWASDGSGSLVDFQQRGIKSLVRASLHYFNTEQEIDSMVKVLSASVVKT